MKSAITLSFFLFIFSNSFGKSSPAFIKDSLLGIEYYNIADSSYMIIPKCKRYSKLAIPLLKKTKQWEKYIDCFGFLSYCYGYEESFDSLIINNKFALKETKKYISKNSSQYVASLSNMGFVYSQVTHEHQNAIKLFKDAILIASSPDFQIGTDADISNVKGVLLKNLGDVFLIKGDYEAAIKYFKEASDYYERIELRYKGANIRLAESYKSIARAYQYQGNWNEAINFLQKLLHFMDSSLSAFPQKHYAYAYTQLAELSINDKVGNQSIDWLKKAGSLFNLSITQKAEINRLYSLFYLNHGNYKQAHKYIDEVFKLKFTKIPIQTSRFHQQKAEIFLTEKNFEKALKEFSKAIKYILPNQKEAIDLSDINTNQKILSNLDFIKILNKSADCYTGLQNQEALKSALNIYKKTAQLSSKVQFQYQSEKSKIFLNKNVYPTYEKSIDIAFQLFKQTNDQSYLRSAFYFIERSKAGVLLEEIQEKESQGAFAISEELVSEKYRLRSEINACEKRLEAETEKAKQKKELIKILNNKLFELNQQLSTLEEEIRKAYPEYADLTKAEIPSIAGIQNKMLSNKRAIVEYFMGTENGYAIFITKDKTEFVKISPKEIEKDVKAVMANLKLNQGIGVFTNPANRIYKNVLGVFDLSGIEELLIIPDGALADIPFEILLTQLPESKNPKIFDYLIKTKVVSYAYSLSLFELQKKSEQFKGNALIVAPIFKKDPSKRLQFSEEDVQVLKGWNHQLLKGEEATLSNFLSQIYNYDLIYLSTHADANSQEPYIEFIDSLLFMNDLYAMNLNSHLVVLSACQTGVGEQQKGEGVMSLARGFAYAGVPSTVATLWKVNEKSTNLLMQNFFASLSNGETKNKAIRKAKLKYLETCEDIKATPYYWAGPVVIGNTDSMNILSPTLPYFYLIGFVLLVGGVGWFFKFK